MHRRLLRTFVVAVAVPTLVGAAPPPDQPEPAGAVHSPNMEFVKNLPYTPPAYTQEESYDGPKPVPNYGSDVEFAELGGREYAFAGSYRNGLQIVDITDPLEAEIVAVYDCMMAQGDVQVFEQDGRTLVSYAADNYSSYYYLGSRCYVENGITEEWLAGEPEHESDFRTPYGSFIIDVSDPMDPQTAGFVPVPEGSHNSTIHPSGDYLYNSNSDLITSAFPGIEVYDISDLNNPTRVAELALPTRPGLGTESHDITFNEDGTRAYSAALSQTVIIDTTDPSKPSVISSFVDPTINVEHQSDPFTLTDPETGQTREFLIIEDEVAGAVGTGQCPNGGVHIYDITGELERNPQKVGYWNIDEMRPTSSVTDTCTAHVFDIHEDEAIMTIAYYNGGVRVVDISNLVGIALGDTQLTGAGMVELGFYRFEGADGVPASDTWAAKTPKIHPVTGDFYLYGNDIARGFDIYKFHGEGSPKGQERSQRPGRWMSPAEAEAFLLAQPRVALSPDTAFTCLLPAAG